MVADQSARSALLAALTRDADDVVRQVRALCAAPPGGSAIVFLVGPRDVGLARIIVTPMALESGFLKEWEVTAWWTGMSGVARVSSERHLAEFVESAPVAVASALSSLLLWASRAGVDVVALASSALAEDVMTS